MPNGPCRIPGIIVLPSSQHVVSSNFRASNFAYTPMQPRTAPKEQNQSRRLKQRLISPTEYSDP